VRSRTNNLLRRRAQNNVRRFGIEPEIEFMARIIHELGVAGVWADAPAHKDKSLCQFCKVRNDRDSEGQIGHRTALVNRDLAGVPVNHANEEVRCVFRCGLGCRFPFDKLRNYMQAFGYNPADAEQGTPNANLLAVWYLVRQDLYLNDQATAFLIVHWKHTLNLIRLLYVIPGDGTELISE